MSGSRCATEERSISTLPLEQSAIVGKPHCRLIESVPLVESSNGMLPSMRLVFDASTNICRSVLDIVFCVKDYGHLRLSAASRACRYSHHHSHLGSSAKNVLYGATAVLAVEYSHGVDDGSARMRNSPKVLGCPALLFQQGKVRTLLPRERSPASARPTANRPFRFR